MHELFGLRYDYEKRNGTHLVLYRDEGIREDELSRIQTKMLQTGQVPRLLPFAAEHLDGCVRLVYDIGSRRMLQQALRTERLSALKALQLLVSVTAMLEECRSYMLREGGFVLRETFLFVGADTTDLSFVYVPLTRLEAPPAAEELERFIRVLTEHVPGEERSVLLSFADYCRSGAFRVKELKRRLIEQLTAASVPKDNTGDLARVRPSVPTWNDPLFDWEAPSVTDAADTPYIPGFMEKADDCPSEQQRPSRRLPTAVAAAGAVGSGWLWSRWLDQQTLPLLHISIGFTLLALDGWLLLRFAVPKLPLQAVLFKRLPKRRAAQSSFTAISSEPGSGVGSGVGGGSLVPASSPTEPVFVLLPEEPLSPLIDPQEYYASLAKHTTLLRRSADVTVLLQPALEGGARSFHACAYLELADKHPPSRIPLGKEPFIIGRSGEHTDYRLSGEGISRQHLEIVFEDGAYAAKDLGSTNGTLWNGESMVPYRAYPLQEGDCLTVARTELRFSFVENVRKTV